MQKPNEMRDLLIKEFAENYMEKLFAVLLMTREIGYKGAYSLQSHIRNTPFIKE